MIFFAHIKFYLVIWISFSHHRDDASHITCERDLATAAWRCESPISQPVEQSRDRVYVCVHGFTHIEGSSVKAIEVVRARLYTIFSRRRRSISQIKNPSNIERIFVTWRDEKICSYVTSYQVYFFNI